LFETTVRHQVGHQVSTVWQYDVPRLDQSQSLVDPLGQCIRCPSICGLQSFLKPAITNSERHMKPFTVLLDPSHI